MSDKIKELKDLLREGFLEDDLLSLLEEEDEEVVDEENKEPEDDNKEEDGEVVDEENKEPEDDNKEEDEEVVKDDVVKTEKEKEEEPTDENETEEENSSKGNTSDINEKLNRFLEALELGSAAAEPVHDDRETSELDVDVDREDVMGEEEEDVDTTDEVQGVTESVDNLKKMSYGEKIDAILRVLGVNDISELTDEEASKLESFVKTIDKGDPDKIVENFNRLAESLSLGDAAAEPVHDDSEASELDVDVDREDVMGEEEEDEDTPDEVALAEELELGSAAAEPVHDDSEASELDVDVDREDVMGEEEEDIDVQLSETVARLREKILEIDPSKSQADLTGLDSDGVEEIPSETIKPLSGSSESDDLTYDEKVEKILASMGVDNIEDLPEEDAIKVKDLAKTASKEEHTSEEKDPITESMNRIFAFLESEEAAPADKEYDVDAEIKTAEGADIGTDEFEEHLEKEKTLEEASESFLENLTLGDAAAEPVHDDSEASELDVDIDREDVMGEEEDEDVVIAEINEALNLFLENLDLGSAAAEPVHDDSEASELDVDIDREDVMGEEEEDEDTPSEGIVTEKYHSLKEAFLLPKEYFLTESFERVSGEEKTDRLIEQISLIVASESNDPLYEELVRETVMVDRLRTKLLEKYGILGNERASQLIESLEKKQN